MKQIISLFILLLFFIITNCSSNSNDTSEPGDSSESGEQNNSSSSVGISSSSYGSSSSVGTSSSSGGSSSSVGISSSLGDSSSSVGISSSSGDSSSSVDNGLIECTRAGLENAVNSYLEAIAAGDYTLMPLTSEAKYLENDHTAGYYSLNRQIPFGEGLWETPLEVDFHRNLIDVDECATFTEIIMSSNTPQYVNGVRLKVTGNEISEVFAIVTQDGDWGFNADNYLRYSKGEDWSELPENSRLNREELRAAGYAYLEYFGDKAVEPLWGTPCARLEGGAYTGDYPNSSCNVGVPDTQMPVSSFTHLVDVNYGMVVVFFYFGGADSHLFRILPTGYRYIHTLTAMKQSDFQGTL